MILDHGKIAYDFLLRKAAELGVLNPKVEIIPSAIKGGEWKAILKNGETDEQLLSEPFRPTVC